MGCKHQPDCVEFGCPACQRIVETGICGPAQKGFVSLEDVRAVRGSKGDVTHIQNMAFASLVTATVLANPDNIEILKRVIHFVK